MYGCQGLINRWFQLADNDATILCQERRQTGVPPFAPYPRKNCRNQISHLRKNEPPFSPPPTTPKRKKLVFHFKNVA